MKKLFRKNFVMAVAAVLMIQQVFSCEVLASEFDIKGEEISNYGYRDNDDWEWDDDLEDDDDWNSDDDLEDDDDWNSDDDLEDDDDWEWDYDLEDDDDWNSDDDLDEDDDWNIDDDWDDDEQVYYTVTFMDGDEIVSEQDVAEGEAAEEPDLEREGYDLEWDESFDSIIEDITINAVWSAKMYKVKFDTNGGKKINKSIYVVYDEKYGVLPVAEKKNFVFEGWYTKKNGGRLITAKTVFNQASEQTLYAHWKKVDLSKPVIKSATYNKGNKIIVNIKPVKGASGYEVCYSTNKKFTKRSTFTINSKKTNAVIRGVQRGKTYYVKVRMYTKYSSKGKMYSSFSNVVKVKAGK